MVECMCPLGKSPSAISLCMNLSKWIEFIPDFVWSTSKMLELHFNKKNQIMKGQLLKREKNRMKYPFVLMRKNSCRLHLIFCPMLEKLWQNYGAVQIYCPIFITVVKKSDGKLQNSVLVFPRKVYIITC